MGLSRHLDSGAIAHANADSLTHARHVKERSAQRKTAWFPEAADENPALEFKLQANGLSLGQGSYWKGFGDTEEPASGEAFETHCNAVNWSRRWNFSSMKRGNKTATVRRKRTSPACEEFVLNFSPWQMRYVNEELKRWEAAGVSAEKRTETLTALVDEIRRDLASEFHRATGRDVVASYIHFDSNKIHCGIVHSRVNEKNELVGDKRLGLAGPWSVAQNRIAKLGLVDPGDQRLKENLERFHSRFGTDRQPLDIRLHDLLDRQFEEMVSGMGDDAEKRYGNAKEYYKGWKIKNRRDAALRSPSSQRVAWDTVRLLTPLLPPQVRTAVKVARTAVQVFQVLGLALDAVSAPSVSFSPAKNKQLEPEKTK